MTNDKSIDDVIADLDAIDPELADEVNSWNPVVGLVRAIVGLRTRQGLTQSELATRVGRSQSAIARLESAEQDPRWTTVHETLTALGHRIQIVPVEGDVMLVTNEQLDDIISEHVAAVFETLRKQALADALVHLADSQHIRPAAVDRTQQLLIES